ncbi:carbohydrate kinase family protein [Chloroflexota bacterium]
MGNIEVVGMGALNIDHLYRVEHILDDGEAVVNEAKSFPGGSAANTIYGLAKLEVNTAYTGTVGDDEAGKMLLQDFQKAGVDTSQIMTKPGATTGSVLCLSDRLGRRSLYVIPGANSLLTIDNLDLIYINQAKWLHLSSFADDQQLKVLLELMDRLASSVKLSFAPGVLHTIKEMTILSPILNRTHLLFVNQREMRHLTGEDVIAGAESCLKQGCHIVVVTLGKGMKLEVGSRTVTAIAYVRDIGNEYAIEPASQDTVSEVDATGAGDAFATGFLYGLLKGKGLYECGCLGDSIARFSLTKLGAREGLPTLTELAQRYHELYNQQL